MIDDINKIPFYTPLYVRKPIVGIVHHLFGESIFLETGWIPAQYVYWSEKIIPRIYRNKRLVAVSDSTRQELLQLGMRNKNIDIVEIPLNIMDTTLFEYMKTNVDEGWKLIKNLINTVENLGGVLTILWHNTTFTLPYTQKWCRLYEKILKYSYEKNAWLTNGRELWEYYKQNCLQ